MRQGPVAKPGKTEAELKEEEELQLVLALSKERSTTKILILKGLSHKN